MYIYIYIYIYIYTRSRIHTRTQTHSHTYTQTVVSPINLQPKRKDKKWRQASAHQNAGKCWFEFDF